MVKVCSVGSEYMFGSREAEYHIKSNQYIFKQVLKLETQNCLFLL